MVAVAVVSMVAAVVPRSVDFLFDRDVENRLGLHDHKCSENTGKS